MRKLLTFLWRPAVSFWGSVGALALYFLSSGPIAWLLWNVHLPLWLALLISYAYCPIGWVGATSGTSSEILVLYLGLWVDIPSIPTAGQAATMLVFPGTVRPPFILEISGALVSAWLVWNFCRMLNRRHRMAARVAPRE